MNSPIIEELRQVADELERKGTSLRPASSSLALAQLNSALGGRLSNEARAVFSVFDGFDDGMADQDTMIYLWSADEIRRNIESDGLNPRGQIIGDYFLSADLLRCDLTVDGAEVVWDERGGPVAKNFLVLCREIAAGTIAP